MTADRRPLPRGQAALLSLFANPDADHAARLAALTPEEWRELADRAESERGEGLLRRAIQRSRSPLEVPPAISERLDALARVRTLRALRQSQALRRITAILAAEGLTPILLKGVRLAWQTYPAPMLRPMRDLDLLLPADAAEHAQKLLLARTEYESPDWAGRYGIEYGHQLPEILDREADVMIEVHHRLNARGWTGETRLLKLMTSTFETIDVAGQSVRVPSAHANLLHIVEHSTLHHLFDNGPSVLADVHFTAAASEIDWPLLRRQAAEMGLSRALTLVAAIAERHGAVWPAQAGLKTGKEVAPGRLAAADAALLRGGEERDQLAFLRRLEARTEAPPGPRAALRAAFQPGAAALAGVAGTAPDNPLRWLAYPVWLVRRMRYYGATRRARASGESSRQVRLLEWLHGRSEA